MRLKLGIWLLFNMLFFLSYGQKNGEKSFESDNGKTQVAVGSYHVIYSESLYLGPTSHWTVNGEVHIYSKNVWIAPTAKIDGTGTLFIHDPATNPLHEGWASQATAIDGNDGAYIDLNMVLNNKKGIKLTDMSVPEFEKGTMPTGDKAAALKIGKSLDMRVDGANVFLNGYDLELSSSGNLLNYSRSRMVVTDDKLSGHMIKNYSTVGTFVFPVGVLAEDYTPATLVPTAAASKIYVSVNTYNAINLNIVNELIGMDRIWNIFAGTKMNMTYTLMHNMQTNGIAYVDADAKIMQNADGGNWIGDVTTVDAAGIHTRTDIETQASNTLSGTWFTKFSGDKKGPTAVDDEKTMTYGENVAINVLENDVPGSSAIIPTSVIITKQPANGTVVVNPDGSITYTPNDGFIGTDVCEYEITDENGLKDRANVTVVVDPRELLIPNVITPNGDGKNDNFVIVGRENYDRIELIIMNRWGNEVYRNADYKDEWGGGNLNEGTYYPIIRAIKGNKIREFKSYLLIKRN
ncbi:T9SS type B sorting domain-containing protein [Sphingobacterium psychroaquaticum]|uniref:T9SS type B sorting domain-containing protein n=1 Tax=Sphingobacterium psychroaquaticum TaxID=561061 RepID=UPI00106C9167|nr:gliding motility-associated C-terminal domain-containing protein [Sphingobacterium psychroaquaticum]QBQ42054.1 T9SS type B sorting domain-containing protein [Sphingobacterium psychroaquaticum]